ncbi:MAG: HAMP domain-containing histidine kinase [Clostridium sp.]|nr:HAMP domain-containing histidine kinase [Clostridium sp.]MCM1550962.1 HAMP domain-containing histidine kinase [Clostridium sp.]
MWNKNKAFRKYIIIMLAVMVVIMAAFNIYIQNTFQKMAENYYGVIAVLLEQVREQYPDFKEEEWIQVLNQETLPKAEMQNLEQYGIVPEDMPILSQSRYQMRILIGGNLLILLLCGGILMLILAYQRQRDRQIAQLVSYIRQIEQGIYALDLEENEEDELSDLKNELYKITVMLKEAARLSAGQKKALADSVSDISHQLKTPLTSVMVLLDNLSESEHMEEETRRRFLSEITSQLTNVNWLVATLLKLSRLDAGVVEFQNQCIDLDALIEQVLDKLAIMAEWKQITLVKEGAEGVALTGDEHWIGEALTNLVKNAIEHSPAQTSVRIRIEDNTVYTAVSVVDAGEGIEEEEQKHIFERFYRSKSAKKDSVGIGLSLCKEIIERQNGYITVSSNRETGTEFLIKFLKS